MKKLLFLFLTQLLTLSSFASSLPWNRIQEQTTCSLNSPLVEKIIITSGTKVKDGVGSDGYPVFKIDNPGSINILYSDGGSEELFVEAGVGGIFDEVNFSESFFYKNNAQEKKFLKFSSPRIGSIKVSYICHNPHSIYCDMRDGTITKFSNVAFNIDEKIILKFDGKSKKLCARSLIK